MAKLIKPTHEWILIIQLERFSQQGLALEYILAHSELCIQFTIALEYILAHSELCIQFTVTLITIKQHIDNTLIYVASAKGSLTFGSTGIAPPFPYKKKSLQMPVLPNVRDPLWLINCS